MSRSAGPRSATRNAAIPAPYGYEEVVPLQREHRVLLPGGGTPEFCRKLNGIAVSVSEFVPAGRDYPVVFVATDAGKSVAPALVLGLEGGENLFVDDAGDWERGCYLPAYVRRFPFCLSPKGMVCVAASYVDKGGIALHDKSGRPTAQWRPIEALLAAFEADLERTRQFCTALVRLQLLEPFTAAMQQPELSVEGMHRVSARKLRALTPAQFKALSDKDWLGLIYAHLHSLESFTRLAARLTARKGADKGSRASPRSRPR
jgi:hypothetical protein